MSAVSFHILVSGRVQGVGFRHFTRQWAEKLGMNGWTRNLYDGRVEVLAQGSVESASQFQQKLKEGPPAASVTEVVTEKIKTDETLDGFVVHRDGDQPWQG